MIKNLIFELGYVTIVYDNNRRLKVPTDQFTGVVAADIDLSAHAILSTGVHGAGDHTLATDNDISVHAAVAGAHHTRYADSEAVAAMGDKADGNPLNHNRYTDSDAVSAMGEKDDGNALNHDRYSDSDAVSAMGAKDDGNALNHDKYKDSDAVSAVEAVVGTLDVLAAKAVGIQEETPVNAVGSVLQTALSGDNNDLQFTAKEKGVIGDDISVEYVDPGTPDQSLGVPAVVGKAIVVNLATTSGVAASTTLGTGDSEVTITKDAVGVAGNDSTIEAVVGTTPSGNLAASKDGTDYLVTLGVDAGTKPSAVLTIADVVIDGETATLDSGETGEEVYEFDWDDDVGAGNIQVDISGAASIAKSKGTGTISGLPVHDETFAIDGDTFTIKRDGTTGANIVDLTACATAEYGVGRFALAALPSDEDTVTINTRVYEFDTNSAITGDVAVDISSASTRLEALQALRDAINGDGSAVVTATVDAANFYVEVTAKLIGTIGNYAVSEACDVGGWMEGYGKDGNMVDGVNPTTEEIVDQIVADFDGTTCTVAKATASTFTVEYDEFGSAGEAIVLTESVTGLAFDGEGTLGGTTAGTDCSVADATAAIIAALNVDTTRFQASGNGAGVVTVVCNDLPYEDSNGIVTAEAMANATWGANFADGVNPAVDNAKNGAVAVAAAIDLLDGVTATGAMADDPLTEAVVKKNFTNGADPGISTIATDIKTAIEGEATAHALVAVGTHDGNGTGVVTAMVETNLANGVDGTLGDKGDVYHDASYLYACIADNTTADTNWRRVSLGDAY